MVELLRLKSRNQPTRSFQQFMVDWEAKMCQTGAAIGDLDVFKDEFLKFFFSKYLYERPQFSLFWKSQKRFGYPVFTTRFGYLSAVVLTILALA